MQYGHGLNSLGSGRAHIPILFFFQIRALKEKHRELAASLVVLYFAFLNNENALTTYDIYDNTSPLGAELARWLDDLGGLNYDSAMITSLMDKHKFYSLTCA